jgi:hypothetical protein
MAYITLDPGRPERGTSDVVSFHHELTHLDVGKISSHVVDGIVEIKLPI